MPQHQVTSFPGDWLYSGMSPDGVVGVYSRRQIFKPLLQSAVESGNATEGSLLGGRISEIEDALHAEAVGTRQRRVPMHMRPGKGPAFPFRRIEAALVHR